MESVTAGVLQIVSGALLIYHKGKPVYYAALITTIAAGIAYLLTPYMVDIAFTIFCFVVAVVIIVRKKSFEKATMMPRLIEIIQRQGMTAISQLAEQLKTTESNIELDIIELKSKGYPIKFDAEKREVIYG